MNWPFLKISSYFTAFCLYLVACGTREQTNSVPVTGLDGKELAAAHCARCHSYVGPEMLPRSVWENDVLPAMGFRMGVFSSTAQRDSVYAATNSEAVLRRHNIYPETAVMAPEDWEKLKAFYLESAPDTVAAPVRPSPIRMGLKHFRYREAGVANRPPLTAMVKILEDKQGLIFSDAKGPSSKLTFLNADLKERFSMQFPTTPVNLQVQPNGIHVTTAGKGIFPSDLPHGAVFRLVPKDTAYQAEAPVILDLQRPVHTSWGDLNGDGLEDIILCEYGNEIGKLSWFVNNGRGGYDKRILSERSGAISAVIRDANGDGLPDIYVLMAQGDEGVFLYENQGDGNFHEKRLLTFSPLNGSTYLELADFNKDGYDDILYVAGDNADKTPILKPYHGIYIYLNDGKGNFQQSFFYPMNGAYKAIARDFDKDGDLDIAAISFFPDYVRYPEESFVYLENKGNLRFEDYSFPEASRGRWIVMDAGDLDGDGDIDLALGSFVYFLPLGDTTGLGKKWLQSSPSVVVLENTTR